MLGSILVFGSILISKTGYKFGMPAVLMFLLVGMFFGSDGLGLQFGNAGQAQFIGMMALSVILFTGGMDTKLKEIRPVIYPGVLLSTVGVLLTTLLTGLFIFFIYKKSYSGVMYSASFGVTLVALSLITTLLIMKVVSNIVSSHGMVGSLSIVRIRTCITVHLDIAF